MRNKTLMKTLSALLAVVMVLCSAPLSGFVGLKFPEIKLPEWNLFSFSVKAEAIYTENGFIYEVNNGEAALTGCTETGAIVIPSTLGGYPVKSIGRAAFHEHHNITSIKIPDSVTTIDDQAFERCTSLESVIVPDSVTTVGNYVFWDCTSLRTITLGDNITNIGNKMFSNCISLISIAITDSVTSIGSMAFLNCKNLTSITVSKSVMRIENHAFEGCSSLKYVVYAGNQYDWENISIGENNVALVDATVFYQTETLEFKEENGVVYSITDTSATVDTYVGIEPKVTILAEVEGKPVTEINKDAFRKNTVLISVAIPDSVVCILDSAFSFCENLIEIDIPDSVIYIGDGAFYGCSSLEKVRLPEKLNHLGECTFFKCVKLSEIIVECANIEKIEDYPFYGCGTKTDGINVVFTEKVCTIPNKMFAILDDWLWDMETTVGEVFLDSSNLKSVTIGKNVSYIGESAFCNNENLVELNFNATNATFANGTFSSCSSLDNVNIGDGVEKIPEYFISDCKSVTNVNIPETVTLIGNNAFSGCSSITELTIPESVSGIEKCAFSNCENLENVVFLGKNKIEIGDNIFDYSPKATICCKENSFMHSYADINVIRYCIIDEANNPNYEIKNEVLISYKGSAENIYLNSVNRIGFGAFSENTALKHIELSSGIDRIYDMAFNDCINLATVIIPKSVTSIGENAFDGCDKLTIYCYADSYAETYAKEQRIDYKHITLDLTETEVEIYSDEVFNLGTSYNIDMVDSEEILWTSGDESVVKIADDGKIIAVGSGTAIITAKTESGLEAECKVTVNAGKRPAVEGVAALDFAVSYKGTTKIEPNVEFIGDVDYTVEYVSSNESVATVDKDGNVTATGTGEAEILVTVTDEYGNVVEDTCTVTVSYAWWQWLIIIFLFGWIWY